MTKDESMITQLQEIFSQKAIEECLEVEKRELFHICDNINDNEKTYIAVGEVEKNFKISNPNQKKVYHLPFDNCFVTYLPEYNPKDGRCDCIIFDDRYFCFAELKLNVESTRKKTVTEKAKEAREQLGTTIEFFEQSFQNASKNFLEYELEAFIVMQREIYPRHRARLDPIRVRFLEQYGVELFEKNEKEF
jgi:hypothetical protein